MASGQYKLYNSGVKAFVASMYTSPDHDIYIYTVEIFEKLTNNL